MLNCDDVLQLLGDYVGQELPAKYADSIKEHLQICPHCEEVVESYQQVIHLGRQLPPLPIPPKILQRLRLWADQHDDAASSLNPIAE